MADYEALLAELREVVERLQAGQLPLPDALALYKRGQDLFAQCNGYLEQAQLEVVQLTANGEVPLV